jgi:O-antigen ligase
MRQKLVDNVAGKLIIWASLITTVAVTPKTTADPINPVKLAALVVFSFGIAALIFLNFNREDFKKYKGPIVAAIAFFLVLIMNLVTSGGNFLQEFYGVYGRNTGFVAYVSLTLLLISSMVVSSSRLVEKYLMALVIVGVVSMIYGYLQFMGLDPAGWNSPYSPIIGFLGNPNFASAFQAISLIATIFVFRNKKTAIITKAGCSIYILLAVFLLILSGGQQGFLVLFIGIAVVVMMRVHFSKFRKLGGLVFVSGGFGVMILFLAILNQGPLAKFVYESSLVSRGHYWRAATGMLKDNPVWGIGLDSFGDWYFRFRSISAYEWLPFQNTNSAHNVYLDIASSGGFPLILAFLVLNLFVVRAIITNIRSASEFDLAFAVMIGCWVGYLSQMFISINQIGLAIWGWTISGLIVGYQARNDESESEIHIKSKKGNHQKRTQLEPKSILLVFTGMLVGCLVGLPPLVADTKYFSEMSTGDPVRIQKAASIWPHRQHYYLQVSITLRDNKSNTIAANPGIDPVSVQDYSELGLSVARDMVTKFPNSFYSWQLLRSFSNLTPAEDELTKEKMRELNPIAYPAPQK